MKKNAKVILFLNDEKALNYKFKVGKMPSSEVLIKSVDFDYDFLNGEYQFIDSTRPSDGALYFLHPYQINTYVSADLAEEYLLREKLNLYKKVASLLGAKSVKSTVKTTDITQFETNTDGEVKIKVVKGDINIKTKSENKLANSLEIEDHFEQEPNFNKEKNIEELQQFIRCNNLFNEFELKELIEGRNSSTTGTSLIKRTIKTEITSEYNNLLEISASLNTPVWGLKVKYQHKFKNIKTRVLELEYLFK